MDAIGAVIGIDSWTRFGFNLTADDIRKAIISKAADYIDARNKEIKRGVKAEDATNVVIVDNDYK